MTRLAPMLVIAAYLLVQVAPLAVHAVGATQFVSGALPPQRRPSLDLDAVLDERFQHGITRWMENHRRLFGHAVYLDNTVLYHGFGETRVGARVRLGRGGDVLFVDEDIDFLNLREHHLPAAATVDALAGRLARVQARLRARGQAVVPVIAPTKTAVYRDAVDPRWRRDLGPRTPSDVEVYQALVHALEAHGVSFVDMRAELTSGRHALALAEIWAPAGRHWSDYAGCLTMERVMALRNRMLDPPALPYACRLGHELADRLHDDFDLWRLLNTWGTVPASFTVPVGLHDAPAAAAPRARALFVGTSFNRAPVRDALRSQAFASVHQHWYGRRMITWPGDTSEPMQAGEPAWAALVASKDLIVLDLMEAAVFSDHRYLHEFLGSQTEAP